MASEPPICENAQCRVDATTKCVEGYELAECPHYGKLSVEDIEEAVDNGPNASETPLEVEAGIPLPLGEPLNRADASALQRRRLSRTVGIIGPHLAGKTSLLAGVYETLQEGPVAGYSFAGSATLPGFEFICHDARVASRRDMPHTERTTQGADATFFHLDLGTGEPASIVSLFIADRSGEDYVAVTDDLSNASGLFELRRADVVTLLVNGEQLADQQLRHELKSKTAQIVDSLVEAGVLGKAHRLAVVLTKKDAVLASPRAERVMIEFAQFADRIRRRHGEVLGEVKDFVVAASPKRTDEVKRGEGVDDLVEYWLRRSPPASMSPMPNPKQNRMMDVLPFTDKRPE